jgi:hypothetical protein
MWSRSSRSALRVTSQYALAGLLLFASAAASFACQVCLEAPRQLVTIGQQLDMADRAVLAVPVAGGNQFRIVEVVKGKDAVADMIADPVTDVVDDDDVALDHGADGGTGDPLLLLRDALVPRWTSLGSIRAEYADWLHQLANTGTMFDPSDAGWRQRIALALPYLENADPLAAQIVWGEVARAPCATIGVVKSRIAARVVASWIDDPKLASRHATYTLLLGFVGGLADAARLEQRIDAVRQSHDTTDLAATLAADLELRGPARVGWVEEMYLADRTRTMPEIEAALLALNVLGDADRTVPRERVIQAYRVFIRERGPMAGFVAPQLADWGYWDAAKEYAVLLEAHAIKDTASEFAVTAYLQRAADAKAARQ